MSRQPLHQRLDNLIAELHRIRDEVAGLEGRPGSDGPDAQSRAIAIMFEHPEWLVNVIARAAGCHPKTLSKPRSRFRAAREALLEMQRRQRER